MGDPSEVKETAGPWWWDFVGQQGGKDPAFEQILPSTPPSELCLLGPTQSLAAQGAKFGVWKQRDGQG